MNRPRSWSQVRLADVAAINPKLQESPDDLEVTFLPMKCVEELSGVIDASQSKKVGQVRKGYTPFQENDILFAKITPCMENGKIAIAKGLTNGRGYGSTEFFVIRCGEKLRPRFLFYFLVQDNFRSMAQRSMTGAVGQQRVPKKFLEEVIIPLPTLIEQDLIVEKMDEIYSETDDVVRNLESTSALLKTYRQALLGKTYGDTAADRAKIGDVLDVYVGATPSRGDLSNWGGNINWISSGEVAFKDIEETRERITDKGLKHTSTTVHPPGTVFLAMIGEGKTRGQAAISRIFAAHNQNTAAIRADSTKISPEYLYYYFVYSYERTREIGSGNNQKALSKTRIQQMTIPLVPIEAQIEAVTDIESKLSAVDMTKQEIGQAVVRARRLRQSAFEQLVGRQSVAKEVLA